MAMFHSIGGNEVEAHHAGGDLRDELDLKADIDGTYSTLIAGGTTPGSVTDPMLVQTGGVLEEVSNLRADWTSQQKRTAQLFDKRSPYNTVGNFYIRTSDGGIREQPYAKSITFPLNVTQGQRLFVTAFGDFSEILSKFSTAIMATTSAMPEVNGFVTEKGAWAFATNETIQADIAITESASYVTISFVFSSSITDTELDEFMSEALENLTVEDIPYPARVEQPVPFYILDVQGDNLSSDVSESLDNAVKYIPTKVVNVGENAIGTATLGAGWTESSGTYTHESGSTADLDFTTSLSVNDIAILDFDTTFSAGEFVSVAIGTAYKQLVYNATTHIRMPLKAVGNTTLHITPLSTFSGSISNITLRKVQDSGTEVELEYKDVLTSNHTETLGFWNTLVGYHTAEDAIGSTRMIAIGCNALRDLQGGHRNIGIGTFAMSQLVGGERNISIGPDSMLAVKGGENNVAIGSGALYFGVAPSDNLVIGSHAQYGDATASPSGNVVLGTEAGFYNKGNNNTFIGKQAGYRNRTGSYNVMIGGQTFGSNGGNGSTFVGYNIMSSTALSDAIGLGNGATPTKSNQMMLGSNQITEVVFCGTKKIIFNDDGTVTWEALI